MVAWLYDYTSKAKNHCFVNFLSSLLFGPLSLKQTQRWFPQIALFSYFSSLRVFIFLITLQISTSQAKESSQFMILHWFVSIKLYGIKIQAFGIEWVQYAYHQNIFGEIDFIELLFKLPVMVELKERKKKVKKIFSMPSYINYPTILKIFSWNWFHEKILG